MRVLRFRAKSVREGQTTVETVFMLVILLILFFFIAEFARAWYMKNSLNNAVRVAVRQAVVTPGLDAGSSTSRCSSVPGGPIGQIIATVCSSPGLPPEPLYTSVTVLRVNDAEPLDEFGPGDTVIVSATAAFAPLVGPIAGILPDFVSSEASMRYE